MPLPNFHACLLNPKATQVLGTKTRSHNGKQYKVKYAKVPGSKKGSVQRSFLYAKSTWSRSEAGKHCRDHGGRFEAASGK